MHNVVGHFDYAQKFRTGSAAGGYRLTRVDIRTLGGSSAGPTHSVSIRSDSSNPPGTSLGTLTNPGSWPSTAGLAEFTAPSGGIALKADTDYWLLFDITGNPSSSTTEWLRYETSSDAEDANPATGWSIANDSRFKVWNVSSWTTDTTSLIFAIHGHAEGPPTLQSASVTDKTLTLTYSEEIGHAPRADPRHVRDVGRRPAPAGEHRRGARQHGHPDPGHGSGRGRPRPD